MSIRLIGVDVEDLTPDICQTFSTMRAFLGERDEKESHIQYLHRKVVAHEFYSPTWAVAIVKGTTERLRCDGQHSSIMLTKIVNSAHPELFPEGLKVVVRKYEIDSLREDAAELFNLFDNPHSTRTNTDAMSLFRAHYPELQNFDNDFLAKTAKGINYYVGDLIKELKKAHDKLVRKAAGKKNQTRPDPPQLPVKHDPRDYGAYFHDPQYRVFAVWLHQWKDARCGWIVKQSGLVAQIVECWANMPERALRYWGYVFREDHPDPEHASHELLLKLRALKAKPRPKADEYRKLAEQLWATYLHKEPVLEPEVEEEEEDGSTFDTIGAAPPLFTPPQPEPPPLSA